MDDSHSALSMKNHKIKSSIKLRYDDKLRFEVQYQDVIGIFDLEDLKYTFEQYMPILASFFSKDINSMFIANEEGHIFLKTCLIWDSIFPFKYSKVHGNIPRLQLIVNKHSGYDNFIIPKSK